MRAEVRSDLLKMLQELPLIQTRHAASLFQQNQSPLKRASEALKSLEEEKLVESRRLGDMTKVWRLTRKGLNETETARRSIPLTSPKTNHYLAIADWYVRLKQTGTLHKFEIELREKFTRGGKEYVFAPDLLYIHDRRIYLAEVQLSRLSKKQWAKKWSIWNIYFGEGFYQKASWQKGAKAGEIKPHIVVISKQDPNVIRNGFRVPDRELVI